MINRGADNFITYLVLSFILVLIVGVFFGWICPIEGPIDYLYDNYASQPAINRPSKGVPAPLPKKENSIIININDLSEEDFEALQEVFVNLR